MQKINWKHDDRMRHILTSLMGLGFEPEDIAKIMGTTVYSIKGAAQAYTRGFRDAKERARISYENEWPRHKIDAVEQLLSEGLSIGQIARAMNCSKYSLRSAIYKYTDGARVIRHRAGLPLAISEP